MRPPARATRQLVSQLIKAQPMLGIVGLARLTNVSKQRVRDLLTEEGFGTQERAAARQEILDNLKAEYVTASAE
jgi:hypothetical protein